MKFVDLLNEVKVDGVDFPSVSGWKIGEIEDDFDVDDDVVSYTKKDPSTDGAITVEFALTSNPLSFNIKRGGKNAYQVLKSKNGESNFKQVSTGRWSNSSDIKKILGDY